MPNGINWKIVLGLSCICWIDFANFCFSTQWSFAKYCPHFSFYNFVSTIFCKWSNANFAQTIKFCKWPSSTSHVCKFFFSLKRYFEHCSLGTRISLGKIRKPRHCARPSESTLPRELYLFLSQLKFQTNLFFAPFSLFLYSLIPIRPLISNPSSK